MTVWNVGKIGGKQMIRFEVGFSTSHAHAQWCSSLEQHRRQQRSVATQTNPTPVSAPYVPVYRRPVPPLPFAPRDRTRARRNRPTVDQLMSRYGI